MSTAIQAEPSVLDREIKESLCRLRGVVPRNAMEAGVMGFLDDLCRSHPRVRHPLGRYPEVAIEAGRVRAPWHMIWKPVNLLKGHVFNQFYAPILPGLAEAVSRETESNNHQNHATHRLLRNPNVEALDAFIEGCDIQIAETRLARAVAVSMKNERVA